MLEVLQRPVKVWPHRGFELSAGIVLRLRVRATAGAWEYLRYFLMFFTPSVA